MTERSSEPDRDALLAAPLTELGRYWLDIRCDGCGSTTLYPCRLLGMRRGEEQRLADVLARLGCRQCGERPAAVTTTDDATGGVPRLRERKPCGRDSSCREVRYRAGTSHDATR